MGDRCYLYVKVFKPHLKKFMRITDMREGVAECINWVSLVDDQANCGLSDELHEAAKRGCVFFGHHTAGEDYIPSSFVGACNKVRYALNTTDGVELIPIREPGVISGEDLKEMQEFFDTQAMVMHALLYPRPLKQKDLLEFFKRWAASPAEARDWLKHPSNRRM